MNYNLATALDLLFTLEGGYVNHPNDPGGSTNMGITQRTYDAWRHDNGMPPAKVSDITKEAATRVYLDEYWSAVEGDLLPSGVDLAVFDFAVHSGPMVAVVCLQRCLQLREDGIVGPKTIAALSSRTSATVVQSLHKRRLAFLKSLPHWPTFGVGWTRRVTEVTNAAISLALAELAASKPRKTFEGTKSQNPRNLAKSEDISPLGALLKWFLNLFSLRSKNT